MTTVDMGATTKEVAHLVGASLRQVRHWSAMGWLHVPAWSGQGNARVWTPEAIRHAAIVAQLVTQLGAAPSRATKVADLATSNTGRSWSVSLDGLLVIGELVWVPEPPEEDDAP